MLKGESSSEALRWITATFTGPRRKSLFPKAARPAAPCATYCYHANCQCKIVLNHACDCPRNCLQCFASIHRIDVAINSILDFWVCVQVSPTHLQQPLTPNRQKTSDHLALEQVCRSRHPRPIYRASKEKIVWTVFVVKSLIVPPCSW